MDFCHEYRFNGERRQAKIPNDLRYPDKLSPVAQAARPAGH